MNRPIKALVLVFGLALVLSLVGCESQTNKNADLAVGEAAEYDGFAVTVVEVAQFGWVDEQTAITVRYENNTDEVMRAEQSDWKLEDANGVRSQETTTGLTEEALPGGEVAPGATVEGRVFFEMPTRNVTKVVYEPAWAMDEVEESTWVAGYTGD